MGTTKKRILIIEDEPSLAHALELKLAHEGFDTLVVFGGEEGLRILEKESFALILLDLIMPKMDGFLVLETLKKKNIHTPVFVLTNLSNDYDEERAKGLGAKEFFIKSNVPIATIVERVTRFLGTALSDSFILPL